MFVIEIIKLFMKLNTKVAAAEWIRSNEHILEVYTTGHKRWLCSRFSEAKRTRKKDDNFYDTLFEDKVKYV